MLEMRGFLMVMCMGTCYVGVHPMDLHEAVGENNIDAVTFLLEEKDIDINLQASSTVLSKIRGMAASWYKGDTALHVAIEHNYNDIATLLLDEENVNVNLQDGDGDSVLHLAVSDAKRIDVLHFLLDKEEIDVNLQNKKGETVLMRAIRKDNYDIVKLLLERTDIDLNLQKSDGQTVLHMLVPILATDPLDKFETLVLLLEKADLDVNVQCYDGQEAALHLAVCYCNMDLLKLLLQKPDIDANIQDRAGAGPLHYATIHDNLEMVACLLSHEDILPNLQDRCGLTPFDIGLRKRVNDRIQDLYHFVFNLKKGSIPLEWNSRILQDNVKSKPTNPEKAESDSQGLSKKRELEQALFSVRQAKKIKRQAIKQTKNGRSKVRTDNIEGNNIDFWKTFGATPVLQKICADANLTCALEKVMPVLQSELENSWSNISGIAGRSNMADISARIKVWEKIKDFQAELNQELEEITKRAELIAAAQEASHVWNEHVANHSFPNN